MKLKYYIVFSIVFLATVFLIVYGITQENYDIGLGFPLPVALWICLIIGVFFIYSVIFLFISWVRLFIEKSTDNRDFDTLIKQIITKNYSSKIKNQNLAKLSKILQRYDLKPNLCSQESGYTKIDKIFFLLVNVQNGEVEDIKKYGFAEFDALNDKNYILKSNKNALEILKDSSKTTEIKRFALNAICDSKKDKDMQKALDLAKDCLDKTLIYKIIETYDGTDAGLDSMQISEYCKVADFKPIDYVKLAKMLQSKLEPDKWVRFFADLASLDSHAQKAHLFTLLELEMVDKALDEIKRDDKEFLQIKAYIDLKRSGKNYPLDIFIADKHL